MDLIYKHWSSTIERPAKASISKTQNTTMWLPKNMLWPSVTLRKSAPHKLIALMIPTYVHPHILRMHTHKLNYSLSHIGMFRKNCEPCHHVGQSLQFSDRLIHHFSHVKQTVLAMNTTDIKVGCIWVNYKISEASGSGSVGLSLQDMCRKVEHLST